MASVVPYINFGGKTQEALAFYKDVFGGEADVTLAKDGPMGQQTPAEKMDEVFHADYKAGDIHILASDMMSDEAGRDAGNVYSLAIMCDSAEQLWMLNYDKPKA
jgi:PhnB protein